MLKDWDPMEYSTYYLDGTMYFISKGIVYTHDDTGIPVAIDMLPSSLQLNGICTDAAVFELCVTGIRSLKNNQALISVEDGAGLSFSFIERDYLIYQDRYKIGEKGIYQIEALLESVELPEDYEDGVCLTGPDAKRFFEWVEDEVEENSSAVVGFQDIGVYQPCDDFEQTGRYHFYGIIENPCCLSVSDEIDAPDPEKISGFTVPLMNQFDKKTPRFITASFESPEYYPGEVENGWAVKAVLKLIGLHGTSQNVYKYGDNTIVCPEEKGLFGHDEDDFFVDEDGSMWLMDEDEEGDEEE